MLRKGIEHTVGSEIQYVYTLFSGKIKLGFKGAR